MDRLLSKQHLKENQTSNAITRSPLRSCNLKTRSASQDGLTTAGKKICIELPKNKESEQQRRKSDLDKENNNTPQVCKLFIYFFFFLIFSLDL